MRWNGIESIGQQSQPFMKSSTGSKGLKQYKGFNDTQQSNNNANYKSTSQNRQIHHKSSDPFHVLGQLSTRNSCVLSVLNRLLSLHPESESIITEGIYACIKVQEGLKTVKSVVKDKLHGRHDKGLLNPTNWKSKQTDWSEDTQQYSQSSQVDYQLMTIQSAHHQMSPFHPTNEAQKAVLLLFQGLGQSARILQNKIGVLLGDRWRLRGKEDRQKRGNMQTSQSPNNRNNHSIQRHQPKKMSKMTKSGAREYQGQYQSDLSLAHLDEQITQMTNKALKYLKKQGTPDQR